jgi:nicotinamidase/pyrazinamidase
MRALLLVTIQNDFLPDGPLPVPRGDEVVAVANRLTPVFELVVAIQDWHPREHGGFASNHPGKKPGDLIILDGQPQILWPDHCVQDTPGASFASGLDVTEIDHVIRTGTDPAIDSFSGFFDNGQRRATDLHTYLKAAGASELYVMGLATEYCVRWTVLDGIDLGYRVTLIEDGCRGIGLRHNDIPEALNEMGERGCRICTSHDVAPRL